MKKIWRLVLGSAMGLLAASASFSQQPCRPELIPCVSSGGCAKDPSWMQRCFPRCGCADDYCARPLPRQCWPCYPAFYRCVPAGDCACQSGGNRREGATWCVFPTCKAFREAVWWQP